MTVDLVLSCSWCDTVYDRFTGLPEDEILNLAEANGWETREFRLSDGTSTVMHLCWDHRKLDDTTLAVRYEGALL